MGTTCLLWNPKRLFIRRNGLKVFVAKRDTEGHEDEQTTQECTYDAARSSGDGVVERRPVAEVSAGFGISERTVRKWLARWRSEGTAGLENRSSWPRSADDGPYHPSPRCATDRSWTGICPNVTNSSR